MTLTPQWLDELRSRTLLSALVGKSIKLTKAGREFKGCCPFHNEKTPSFYVNDDKGFYHCFGCSAHGDAIRWMTDQRGLPFMDAVKELADAAGMDVPAPDPRAAERAERANSLYDVMSAAAQWFVDQLHSSEGEAARAYLKQRGLSQETIKRFGMGFAPDTRGRLKAALARFGEEQLIESGLLIKVDEKKSYDRFRGRLMIPIRDARGRVIAFGGRILGAGEPKYLNSPDTPLFDKGRTLYNLDQAGPESRKTNRVIVVEGYMDVIALAQAGINDAVAPLGTALTESQLERLWRLSGTPILCFDGDKAGQKASVRAIGRALPALAPARSLNFVSLPEGQDPDDLIKAQGRSAMDALLDAAEPLVNRLWRAELEAEPLSTPEAKAGLKRRLNDHAQAIQDPDVKNQYQSEFRHRFEETFPFNPRKTSPAARNSKTGPYSPGLYSQRKAFEAPPLSSTKNISGKGIEPHFARPILAGFLRHPSVLLKYGETIAAMPIAENNLDQLRNTMIEVIFDDPALDSQQFMTICKDKDNASLVTELMNANTLAFSFTKPQANVETAVRDLGLAIEALSARPELDAALEAATAKLSENWDEDGFLEQTRLMVARKDADQKLASLAQGDDE
jgi:DNA primase